VKHDTDPSLFASYTAGVDWFPQGEQDMGFPAVLSDFVAWAKANYPARRYALILSDHGNGVNGAMQDDLATDLMSVKQLAGALATATNNGTDRLDVLVMFACLMGMIEDAYEVRSYVNHYVAFENEGWATYESFATLVSGITATTSPVELATLFVNGYADDVGGRSDSYTVSAVFPSRALDVAAAAGALAQLLTSQITTTAPTLTTIGQAVQRYDSNGDRLINTADEYIDLYDFAARVKNGVSDLVIQNVAQAVMDAVNVYVFAERHDSYVGNYAVDGSHGVSIFFPSHRRSFYNGDNFAFAAGTSWPGLLPRSVAADPAVAWGNMLVAYLEVTQPGGPDDPVPPPLLAPLLPGNQPSVLFLPQARR
jgi:hypothetical protein